MADIRYRSGEQAWAPGREPLSSNKMPNDGPRTLAECYSVALCAHESAIDRE